MTNAPTTYRDYDAARKIAEQIKGATVVRYRDGWTIERAHMLLGQLGWTPRYTPRQLAARRRHDADRARDRAACAAKLDARPSPFRTR